MRRTTRRYVSPANGIRLGAVIVMLVSVLMYLGILDLPGLKAYTYWLAVLAFGLLLLGKR